MLTLRLGLNFNGVAVVHLEFLANVAREIEWEISHTPLIAGGFAFYVQREVDRQ